MSAAAPAGAMERDQNFPRSYYLDAEGQLHRDLPPRELAEIIRSGQGELWVDIDSTSRHQFALLEKIFNFHPLAIEDTLNPNSRVKLEEYAGYLFMIIRGVRFLEETPDPYDTQTLNLYFFLGDNYLVTVHSEPSAALASVADRISRTPDVLGRGIERTMHAMMDAAVDAYFPIIDQIDEFVDSLETRVFERFDEAALRDIFSVKRLVLSLRRHLAPQREVFNILSHRPSALLRPEAQLYFRDVYDHVIRITDLLDTYREMMSSVLDSYLTQVSNRLGSVTKALAIVATASIPFVVVSGMWGMNFDAIPFSGGQFGFWGMVLFQLGLAGVLIWFLRRQKLL